MSLAPASKRSLRGSARTGDWGFITCLSGLGGLYVLLIILLIGADLAHTSWGDLRDALGKPEIRFAIKLTLITCTVSALLSVLIATPLGYVLSRFRFPGRWVVDTLLDIPVVLPPLVIGLSLLILFNLDLGGMSPERAMREWLGVPITYTPIAVVLAQFSVACAFAVRTMHVTFDQVNPRTEQVAWTLGCGRASAFFRVALPQAGKGLLAAFTLAWARSLGEFGPILVFAGATRMRTEVLSSSVFLELSVGRLDSAVAVSLVMVGVAVVVLVTVRLLGSEVLA